jgi:hypothetical protein
MAEPCRPQPTTGVWAGSSPHRRRGLRAPFGTKHYLRLHRQVHGWSLLCMHSSGELKPRSSAANWVKASSSRRNSNCRSREGQTEGLPGRTEGGSACASVDSDNARSPPPALPRPPWHGRGQGFESPKLHSLFLLASPESHFRHGVRSSRTATAGRPPPRPEPAITTPARA